MQHFKYFSVINNKAVHIFFFGVMIITMEQIISKSNDMNSSVVSQRCHLMNMVIPT